MNAAIIQARFGSMSTEMMLDSGSAVSLVRQDIVSNSNIVARMPLPQIQLVTAAGDKLPTSDYIKATIELQLFHSFDTKDGQRFVHF